MRWFMSKIRRPWEGFNTRSNVAFQLEDIHMVSLRRYIYRPQLPFLIAFISFIIIQIIIIITNKRHTRSISPTITMQFSTLLALALPAVALAAPAPVTARAAGWSIRKFSRNCTDPNICTYDFTIDTGSGTQQCTTVDVAFPATTHPWYGVSCQQASLPFLVY